MTKFCLGALAVLLVIGVACSREQPPLKKEMPAPGEGILAPRTSGLVAGTPTPSPGLANPYEDNVHAASEGKRLYSLMNCSGCHAAGGGAIGPPLMDSKWIYGSDPANVFQSIVQGRPNGMPAYGGRLPEQEIWKLVTYVRSLSGLELHRGQTLGRSQGEQK